VTDVSTIFEMVSHFQQLAEREKSSLARQLHDDLGGCLIGAVMDLSMLAPGIASLGADAQDKMTRVRRALGDAIEIARHVTEQLRPTLLDNVGLFAALRWQLKNACAKTQVKCTDDLPTSEPQLNSPAAIALFRSAQEALIVGLERPDVTELDLVGSLDDKELSLRLASHGSDLPVTPTDISNLMLESLRHRIRTLGGVVQVDKIPSGGIVLAISAPIENLGAAH
jgi:two-component system, NarL family, sensor histidine kinase UhpB